MSELLEVSGNKVVCMVNYDGGENITKLNEEYVMEIEIELEYEEWVKLAFAGIIFNSFFCGVIWVIIRRMLTYVWLEKYFRKYLQNC